MNIIAIDCCLKITGVAVWRDVSIVPSSPLNNNVGGVAVVSGGNFEYEQNDLGRRQSSELPKITERLLQKNNLSWREVDYVALTNGPGYFTGIRVGAAYASGLAYACGAKIIPISSLEMLAHNLTGKILVLIYAGHGFVYASCKNFLNAGEYSHAEILSWLEKNPDAKIISDDPARLEISGLEISQVRPSVKNLCEIAAQKINLAINPMELKISYYRAPQGVN